MRRVTHHMGMPISIDIPGVSDESIFVACWELLNRIDNAYSPYKKTSEVYRIASGKLRIDQASDELQSIVAIASEYEHSTNHYFSVHYNGVFNPSGIVKGWAIQQVADQLTRLNVSAYMINAGGDIACKSSAAKQSWVIEISNPHNPNATIGTITLDNAAVATSGNYQKGNHIYNPKNRATVHELQSVTVIGPDIIGADVYATTLFAMGHKAIRFAATLKEYKCIIVDNNDIVYSI